MFNFHLVFAAVLTLLPSHFVWAGQCDDFLKKQAPAVASSSNLEGFETVLVHARSLADDVPEIRNVLEQVNAGGLTSILIDSKNSFLDETSILKEANRSAASIYLTRLELKGLSKILSSQGLESKVQTALVPIQNYFDSLSELSRIQKMSLGGDRETGNNPVRTQEAELDRIYSEYQDVLSVYFADAQDIVVIIQRLEQEPSLTREDIKEIIRRTGNSCKRPL